MTSVVTAGMPLLMTLNETPFPRAFRLRSSWLG